MMANYLKTAILALAVLILASCGKDGLEDKVETIRMYVAAETGTYRPWAAKFL